MLLFVLLQYQFPACHPAGSCNSCPVIGKWWRLLNASRLGDVFVRQLAVCLPRLMNQQQQRHLHAHPALQPRGHTHGAHFFVMLAARQLRRWLPSFQTWNNIKNFYSTQCRLSAYIALSFSLSVCLSAYLTLSVSLAPSACLYVCLSVVQSHRISCSLRLGFVYQHSSSAFSLLCLRRFSIPPPPSISLTLSPCA